MIDLLCYVTNSVYCWEKQQMINIKGWFNSVATVQKVSKYLKTIKVHPFLVSKFMYNTKQLLAADGLKNLCRSPEVVH